jgi:ketosteroid isomerase-like protein
MIKTLSFLPVLFLSSSFLILGQESEQESSRPEDVPREWFERWNALDGSEETTNHLLELYLPNAIHQVPPSEHQIGAVVLEGQAAIKKMIEEFAEDHIDLAFRIEWATAHEESRQLVHLAEGPWGGTSVGVQYVGVYTLRDSSKRFMYPGAAFFQIREGRIRNARFYMVKDELTEISAP